ncbi:MAG: peptidoglycan DD-metalloendopeptidase family protein [Pseudomonadota bacterium]
MNRPDSPLLHDYKPAGTKKNSKPNALLWFGAGLGLPLALVAFVSLSVTDAPEPSAPFQPTLQAVTAPVASNRRPEPEIVDAPETLGEIAVPSLPVDDISETKVYTDEPSVLLSFAEPPYDELSVTISRGDTLDELFRDNGLSASHLVQMARLNQAGKYFRSLKPGDQFQIRHEDGKVISLYSKLDLTSGLQVARTDSGFIERIIEHPVEKRVRVVYGLIQNSLFQGGADAGLSDNVIMDLAGIFGWDVDFVYDIRPGDNFYVQYEEIWQDGEFVKDGDILAAEFNNQGRTLRAVRYEYEDGREEYFTPEGRSVRKAFMRQPVDARVSSRFNPRRLHPVLNTIRPHRGVDYAAPTGTPIKATGDGKVVYRSRQRGYGNVVILEHGGNIRTLYAHLSRFQRGVGVGSRVRQGQIIGYVGATGMVTGAHLHYEFLVNGVHRNPLTVPLPQAEPIAASEKGRFARLSTPVLDRLNDYKQTQLASIALSAE